MNYLNCLSASQCLFRQDFRLSRVLAQHECRHEWVRPVRTAFCLRCRVFGSPAVICFLSLPCQKLAIVLVCRGYFEFPMSRYLPRTGRWRTTWVSQEDSNRWTARAVHFSPAISGLLHLARHTAARESG